MATIKGLSERIEWLNNTNKVLREELAKADLELTLVEQSRLDEARNARLRGFIREIYSLRGEDPLVASLCNKALS